MALRRVPHKVEINFVKPLYKSTDKSSIDNYRSITILFADPKLFKAVITNYLMQNLKNNCVSTWFFRHFNFDFHQHNDLH